MKVKTVEDLMCLLSAYSTHTPVLGSASDHYLSELYVTEIYADEQSEEETGYKWAESEMCDASNNGTHFALMIR